MSGEDRISGSRAMVSTDDVWGIVSDAGESSGISDQ